MTRNTSAFRDAADFESRKYHRGENGCFEYTEEGVGSKLLALSQKVRGAQDITSAVESILDRNDPHEIAQLVLLLFVTRNTRGGKGEKKLAYDMFLTFTERFPDTAELLLPLFPLYGYWKDLFLLMAMSQEDNSRLSAKNSKKIHKGCLQIVKAQWDKDLAAMVLYKTALANASSDTTEVSELEKKGPKISLLAKWLPREGKAFDKQLRFVDTFAAMAYPQQKRVEEGTTSDSKNDAWKSTVKRRYRAQVSEMTSYLKLPEVLLAAKRADEIEIQRVASKATMLLTNAFLNEQKDGSMRSEDPKRMRLRELYIDTIVEKGLKGGQVMPHEIVATIRKNRVMSKAKELALQAQWKNLWAEVVEQVQVKAREEGLDFDPTRMVPMVDVSGSMEGTPIDVSIALGIGISEITHEAYRDRVLTFHDRPTWHCFDPQSTVVQKVRKLESAPWGMNTDFELAYDLILNVCVEHKLRREDMPCLIVLSDMQFDEARTAYNWGGPTTRPTVTTNVMFEHLRNKVQAVASRLQWTDGEPKPIVFWNLRNTDGHPVDKDTEGAVLLSGFSPAMLKLVMNGEALEEEEVEVVQEDGQVVTEKVRVTPIQILTKMLNDPLYDPVREILGKSTEGVLREFELLPGDSPSVQRERLEDEPYEIL